MTKKNHSNKSKKLEFKVQNLNKLDVSVGDEAISQNLNILGFDSDEDILNEINDRLLITNRNTFLIKHLPRHVTRISLKQLIPEMVTCRFPICSDGLNKGFAFIQMKTDEMVDKYLEKINETKIGTCKLITIKLKSPEPFKSLKEFDLKTLYFNGLKSETKCKDIKEHYPNAKILFPVNKDKSSKGSLTLFFKSKGEALEAFAENKLTLNGVKVQLNYLIKERLKNIFNFEQPEEIIEEIKKRFESLKDRNIVIKNVPKQFTLKNLRELLPSMRSCKLCVEKCLGFVFFDNSSLASEALVKINSSKTDNKSMWSFVAKMPTFEINSLSQFELESLHLSNLPMDTTVEDVEKIFDNCAVDLPLNPDNSCIGNATLTFQTKEECLCAFSKNGVKIRGVVINVNFRRVVKNDKSSKTKEISICNKRKLEVDFEEITEKTAKKARIETKEDVVESFDKVTKGLKPDLTKPKLNNNKISKEPISEQKNSSMKKNGKDKKSDLKKQKKTMNNKSC